MIKLSFAISLFMLCTCLQISEAKADLRVLMSFDDQGHVVQKVLNTGERTLSSDLRSENNTNELTSNSIAKKQSESKINRAAAKVTWLGKFDRILLVDNIQDPRTSHAPLVTSLKPNYYRRKAGVYLLTAPAGATHFVLELPEFTLDGQPIPSEYWEIILSSSSQ